jgi:hypothetical protein
MDVVIQGLQSQDIKLKISTAENFLKKLQKKTWFMEAKVFKIEIVLDPLFPTFSILFTSQNDLKTKVMSSAISLLNDANPKVVMLGFDCLQYLVSDYGEYYQPLINMSFELLITKFSDTKVSISNNTSLSLLLLRFFAVSNSPESHRLDDLSHWTLGLVLWI